MKKAINIVLILTFIMTLFVSPVKKVEAKTLRDIKNAVEEAERKLKENKNKQVETEAEMKAVRTSVYNNLVEVDNIMKSIAALNEEIAEYDKEISLKNEEINKLLNFVQKTEGNNAYLEYIFGAEDFSDLIYRTAVAEQLSRYNNSLIDKYNKMIDENNKAKEELEAKQADLVKKRGELEKQYSKLSAGLRDIEDAEPTLEEDVKLQRETYQFYVDLGCNLDDDIDICGKKLLPPSTALYRPLEKGYFAYGWGNRCYWLRGEKICDFHKGLDVSDAGLSVPVYAAGAGRVVAVVKSPNHWTCGGQVVFISHNVRGKYYTTVYMHLRKIFVKKDDLVDKNTVIAYMGGNPSIETYDRCTNGQHLHFAISEGMFVSWSKSKATLFNPTTIINFPKLHTRWSDRITEY